MLVLEQKKTECYCDISTTNICCGKYKLYLGKKLLTSKAMFQNPFEMLQSDKIETELNKKNIQGLV